MKPLFRPWASRLAALLVGTALMGSAFAQAAPSVTWPDALRPVTRQAAPATAPTNPDQRKLTAEEKQAVLDRIATILSEQAFVPGVDFVAKWKEMLEAQKEALDKAETAAAFSREINGMLNRYGLSHISLFTPSFGEQRVTQRRAGIGIRIQIEAEGVRVTDMFPDGPAKEAGIQIGDLIVEADGKPVRGPNDIQGERGQTSKFVVKRGEQRVEISVTRRDFSTVIPESIRWEGDYAVVKIPTFDIGYNQQNVAKIMGEAQRAKGLILDLRSNGGGRVTNLQHLAAFFLDPETQPLGTFIGRAQVRMYEERFGPTTDLVKIAENTRFKVRAVRNISVPRFDKPVTVLVDGGTGSASEMMAAALQEIRGSTVIGSKTAGAVLASLIVRLNDPVGYWIQYPLTDYVTIKGRRLEGNGVEVNIPAGVARFGEPDPGVQAAVRKLDELASSGG